MPHCCTSQDKRKKRGRSRKGRGKSRRGRSSRSRSRRSRKGKRSRSTSRKAKRKKDDKSDKDEESDGDCPSEDNNVKPIGKYVHLGGGRGTQSYPRSQKLRLCRAMASQVEQCKSLLHPIRTSTLTEDMVDRLLYIGAGLQPWVKMKGFKVCKDRGQLKKMVVDESIALGHRMKEIWQDFGNLEDMSDRLGYTKKQEKGGAQDHNKKADRSAGFPAAKPTPEEIERYKLYWEQYSLKAGGQHLMAEGVGQSWGVA